MLRYALYARKSDEKREVTEKSTGEQLAQCRPLALHLGAVVHEFEESRSAKTPGVRPQFAELLRLIRRGEVNAIFCWKVDRLARNMREGGEIAQLLTDGLLREIRTPFECHRPGDNVLPLAMQMASSAQYSRDLKANVERGLAGHFERGGWNGRAPHGYCNARDPLNPKAGIVVPDPERFRLVRQGWDMMLTGAYGPSQVARAMNEELCFRTRRTAKGGNSPLSHAHAYKLFANPFYAGYTWYMGELRKGLHEPMVTEAEFQQVQVHLRAGGRATRTRASVHESAYAGLMRCARCDLQVTVEHHQIKARGGTRRPFVYYRCTDSRGTCGKKGMSEGAVEEAIAAALGALTIDPELCRIAEECLLRAAGRLAADAAAVACKQREALADVTRRQERLMGMWVNGLLTDEGRYKQAAGDLEREKRDLTLRAADGTGELERMRTNATLACRFLRLAPSRFHGCAPQRKREIASALAAGYSFDGPARRLDVTVKPLLSEVVRFARDLTKKGSGPQVSGGVTRLGPGKRVVFHGAFEPSGIGSGSVIRDEKNARVLCGRASVTTPEPNPLDKAALATSKSLAVVPDTLLRLLRDGDFPVLAFEDAPRIAAPTQRHGTDGPAGDNVAA